LEIDDNVMINIFPMMRPAMQKKHKKCLLLIAII